MGKKSSVRPSLGAPRVVSLFEFAQLCRRGAFRDVRSVCVVSGSLNEPELAFLDTENYIISFPQVNLDEDWKRLGLVFPPCDLVLCNQVLEHIFSPAQALENLRYLVGPKGLIYITVPTINRGHGEPYFYSSGYHPRFLRRLAQNAGLEVLHEGWWGSRLYATVSVAGKWLPMHSLLRLETVLPRRLTMWHTQHSGESSSWITDTWALLRVPCGAPDA